MITLWILAILVIFALGLGQRASLSLKQARYQRDRLKATYLAKAGMNRAIVELEKDAKENTYDSLNESWNTGKDSNHNNIFENIEIIKGSGEKFTVHVIDEESKININRIADQIGQKQILEIFLSDRIEPKLDPTEAEKLTNTIIDWIDDNSVAIAGGEEDPTFSSFKNKALVTSEQLLVILEYFYQNKIDDKEERLKKVQEVFSSIKDLITVYGQDKVNINTVSPDVLIILVDSLTLALSSEQKTCLETVISDIIRVRNERIETNPDEIPFKSTGDIPLDKYAICTGLFPDLISFFVFQSNYFNISSIGNVGQINKNITAIYDRNNHKIISWHEN